MKPHPQGKALKNFILEFGRNNSHLAAGKENFAAWFVSNCHTPGGRERLVSQLQQNVTVDIYGQCGDKKCLRANADECYKGPVI